MTRRAVGRPAEAHDCDDPSSPAAPFETVKLFIVSQRELCDASSGDHAFPGAAFHFAVLFDGERCRKHACSDRAEQIDDVQFTILFARGHVGGGWRRRQECRAADLYERLTFGARESAILCQ